MSLGGREWQYEYIQKLAKERGLVDEITAVYPEPSEGWPHHIEGYRNGERVKYYVHLTEEGWLCEHRELDI